MIYFSPVVTLVIVKQPTYHATELILSVNCIRKWPLMCQFKIWGSLFLSASSPVGLFPFLQFLSSSMLPLVQCCTQLVKKKVQRPIFHMSPLLSLSLRVKYCSLCFSAATTICLTRALTSLSPLSWISGRSEINNLNLAFFLLYSRMLKVSSC